MKTPIEIMDEIEDDYGPGFAVQMSAVQRRSLRTAIEAQTEELAQAKARIARLEQAGDVLANHHVAPYSSFAPCLCKAHKAWREALNESPAQSIAAVKAEALRGVESDGHLVAVMDFGHKACSNPDPKEAMKMALRAVIRYIELEMEEGEG